MLPEAGADYFGGVPVDWVDGGQVPGHSVKGQHAVHERIRVSLECPLLASLPTEEETLAVFSRSDDCARWALGLLSCGRRRCWGYSAAPGSTFRVWSCVRWTVGEGRGRVAAAGYSPDDSQLRIATTEEPVFYCVSFMGEGEEAIPVMDLSKVGTW